MRAPPSLPQVDLLDPDPGAVDHAVARRALDFVWATGDGMDEVDRALAPRPTTPSTFEPDAFADDLFVSELVRRCLPVRALGERHAVDLPRMVRIVARPPSDPRVLAHRRAVLRELTEDDARREGVEALYVRIRELRTRLGASTASRDRASDRLRRIDALVALRAAVEATRPLRGARSALAAIDELGAAIRALPAWARLVEVLAWESGAATIELAVRLGSDGAIRGVTTLARTTRPAPAGESTLARLLRRVLRALRGERWDEAEVVARLLDEVFAPLDDATLALLRIGLDLEPLLGSLGLRERARAVGLDAALPAIAGARGSSAVRLDGLWNPFLLAEAESAGADAPIACDLRLDDGPAIAVVTGPNSGGKTRLLQSIAIAVLLGQGGFFVPAASAAWPWVPSLFASVVQLGRHDAEEGRLGTELLRVRAVFEHARPGCLVVLDELCSGTNPSEAEELVRFVVEQLAALGAVVVVTTHLLDVARRLETDPPAARLAFRQVELAADERPTFRFVDGVAPSSLARRTAERLGVTRDALAALVASRGAIDDRPAVTDDLAH